MMFVVTAEFAASFVMHVGGKNNFNQVVSLGVRTKVHSTDGDTVLILENNQQADGDTGTRLENDDGCSLKKQKHVTCFQKVNKQSSLGWKM